MSFELGVVSWELGVMSYEFCDRSWQLTVWRSCLLRLVLVYSAKIRCNLYVSKFLASIAVKIC